MTVTEFPTFEERLRNLNLRHIPLDISYSSPPTECDGLHIVVGFAPQHAGDIRGVDCIALRGGVMSFNDIYYDSWQKSPLAIAKDIMRYLRMRMLEAPQRFPNPVPVFVEDRFKRVGEHLEEGSIPRDLFIAKMDDPIGFLTDDRLTHHTDKDAKKRQRDNNKRFMWKAAVGCSLYSPFVAADFRDDGVYVAIDRGRGGYLQENDKKADAKIDGKSIVELVGRKRIIRDIVLKGTIDETISDFDRILWSQHPAVPFSLTTYYYDEEHKPRLLDPAEVVFVGGPNADEAIAKLKGMGYQIRNLGTPNVERYDGMWLDESHRYDLWENGGLRELVERV